MTAQEVTGVSPTGTIADDEVRMNLRPILAERDISSERGHLDLLVDGDLLVALLLPIEVAEGDVAEGADAAEVGCGESVLDREGLEHGHRLVTTLEDESEGALAVHVAELFVLHRAAY